MGQERGFCTLPLHPDAHCCPHSQEALFTAEDALIQLGERYYYSFASYCIS